MNKSEKQSDEMISFWRVAEGVVLAEMPVDAPVRPPLLSEWESAQAGSFRGVARRNTWLVTRALAKNLVREQTGLGGVIDIRDSEFGENVIFQGGMPVPDKWLSTCVKSGRISVLAGDRPIGMQMRCVHQADQELVSRFCSRNEFKTLHKLLAYEPTVSDAVPSILWTIKDAAIDHLRGSNRATVQLSQVRLESDLTVTVDLSDSGYESLSLHLFVLKESDGVWTAIVGKPVLGENVVTRIVIDAKRIEKTSDRDTASSKRWRSGARERAVIRARRIADARSRWQRLRWLGG